MWKFYTNKDKDINITVIVYTHLFSDIYKHLVQQSNGAFVIVCDVKLTMCLKITLLHNINSIMC